MENDKVNWRNAFISCIIVSLGSLLIISANKAFNLTRYLLIQPIGWLLVFSPILTIELINRIQKRKENNS